MIKLKANKGSGRHRCGVCGSQRSESDMKPTKGNSGNNRDVQWVCKSAVVCDQLWRANKAKERKAARVSASKPK